MQVSTSAAYYICLPFIELFLWTALMIWAAEWVGPAAVSHPPSRTLMAAFRAVGRAEIVTSRAFAAVGVKVDAKGRAL